MIVGAPGDEAQAAVGHALAEGAAILHHVLHINTVIGAQRLAEGHGLAGDDVHERAALSAGEDGLVDLRSQLVRVREDEATARTAQGLVARGSDDVGVGHRARVQPRGHEARDVGHVHHEIGAHLMGDFRHALEVDEARVGRGAADDDLRAALLRDALELVVVDGLGLGIHAVGDDVVQKTGEVHGAAVGEMAAVVEAHAEHRVAGLDDGKIRAEVRAGTGMGLHVGVLRAVQLAGAVAGKVLHHVDLLAAAVVALAGVPFGVLVGEHAAHGLHDGAGGEVLRRDELHTPPLAGEFLAQAVGHLRIFSGEKFQSHLLSPLLIFSKIPWSSLI